MATVNTINGTYASSGQSDDLLRALHFLPGSWLVIDLDKSIIVDQSTLIEDLLGFEPSELRGGSVTIIYETTDLPDWTARKFDHKIVSRPGRHEDVGIRSKDERCVIVDVHVSHLPQSDHLPWAICLITDRTEQRRLQGRLIDKHKELRKAFIRLEQQSKELQDAKNALESTNRQLGMVSTQLSKSTEMAAMGEITAELAHQLGNPLAAAIGAARRIDKSCSPTATGKTAKMLTLLDVSLGRMHTTLNELRNVFRTSRSSAIPSAPFSLHNSVNCALALMQQRLESIQLSVDIPVSLPDIWGRESQIQHVIINLLDNAIEAVGSNGTISISAKDSSGHVLFTIGDSGPGIPLDMREKVFEPFHTTRDNGSGLGLALVQRNLEQDKAAVYVDESPLGGAVFGIKFKTQIKEG